MKTNLHKAAALITKGIVECRFYDQCRKDCSFLTNERPIPDFIGEEYDGLVIIATNPAPAKSLTDKMHGDAERARLAGVVSQKPTAQNHLALSRYLATFMGTWGQRIITGEKWRTYLGYDIKKVAAINLVKCRTTKPVGNPMSRSVIGEAVTKRCFQAHTLPQLQLLVPRYAVAQWGSIAKLPMKLGWSAANGPLASFNGDQRNSVSDDQRVVEIKPVFTMFLKEQRGK
jgi:hypothetical protein